MKILHASTLFILFIYLFICLFPRTLKEKLRVSRARIFFFDQFSMSSIAITRRDTNRTRISTREEKPRFFHPLLDHLHPVLSFFLFFFPSNSTTLVSSHFSHPLPRSVRDGEESYSLNVESNFPTAHRYGRFEQQERFRSVASGNGRKWFQSAILVSTTRVSDAPTPLAKQSRAIWW